jgi:hypothetical protein
MSKYLSVTDAFYRQISPEPMSGCWIWTGPENGRGYGRVQARTITGRRSVYAHHFALEIERGIRVAPGQVVRHKCDNTFCVNPDHLLVGTHSDNVADRQERKRQSWGLNHPRQRLSEEDVRDIRRRALTQKEYGRKYNISDSHVSRIQSGNKWRLLA